MAHLLHLDAGARAGSLSHSRELGRAFAAHWRTAHPAGTYTYRDLVTDPVAPIGEARARLALESSRHGVRDLAAMDRVAAAAGLAEEWAATRPLVEQLLAADVLLIGAPMYNFSVPAALKAWIDRVTLPWLPLAARSAVVLTARGGAYGPGTPREPFDFQEPYLRAYFTALGLEDVEFVHTELTHAPVMPFLADFRDAHETSRAAALDAVRTLAARAPAGARDA
ncbi:FMN-dependent NADH-azoreductase [Nonomuraea muscovyensis]|uniref:FMN dependent NADH:quinone oxidoreductase n=1 Tax=Nonomuraea muscovyensis TaxID=1124761 RepID=A0A7X0C5Y0_9ACTN|nr:NAD(P)H-dependent oxidoreductase [Nonomuraea muscovyensis]MBB6348060.1 FMN-dependent NADH-azoreductase [Nonomuraea muscovyensis]MDF2707967.1 (acyl-carrier-protein) phosphodiesterase [Nonomuraea muscovyensis]